MNFNENSFELAIAVSKRAFQLTVIQTKKDTKVVPTALMEVLNHDVNYSKEGPMA